MEERKKLAKEKAQEKLRQREEKKLRKRQETAAKLKKRLESMEVAKKEEHEKRIMESKAQTDYMRRKRAAAVESARLDVLKTLVRWAKKEAKRRKARKQRLAREAAQKLRAIEEKYDKNIAYIHDSDLLLLKNQSPFYSNCIREFQKRNLKFSRQKYCNDIIESTGGNVKRNKKKRR